MTHNHSHSHTATHTHTHTTHTPLTTHTHSLRVLKLMLDGVMGRVLEVYHSISKLSSSDYVLLENTLCDLKLKPQDVDIPIPAFFKRDNMKAIKDRYRVLDALNAKTLGMCGYVCVCLFVCECGFTCKLTKYLAIRYDMV